MLNQCRRVVLTYNDVEIQTKRRPYFAKTQIWKLNAYCFVHLMLDSLELCGIDVTQIEIHQALH